MAETSRNTNKITRLQTEMKHVKDEIIEVKKEQKAGFDKVLAKIDSLDARYVRQDMYAKDMEDFQRDLENRAGNKKWLWQTIGGVVIGIIVGGLFNVITEALVSKF